MSIDAVAAAAGVTKPTIYLRYPNKVALATAALSEINIQGTAPVHGDVRLDLIEQLRELRTNMERSFSLPLIGSMWAEEHETPELFDLFRKALVQPRRQALQSILAAAQTSGVIAAKADINIAVTLLIGASYAQYLTGDPFPLDWAERTVDTLLYSLL